MTSAFDKLLEGFNPEPLVDSDDKVKDDCNLSKKGHFRRDAKNAAKELQIAPINLVLSKINTRFLLGDKWVINFATSNILNLGMKKEITVAAMNTIKKYGVGSCGPRGFYGTVDVHLTLEERIASFMNMEEAVVYSCSYSAVASCIPAYIKREDILFCDSMISAAALNGLKAAKCTYYTFQHNDVKDLERKIEQIYEQISKKKQVKLFLYVEGIYGSTGSICDLRAIVKIRSKYRMRLFLDETWSIGVLGNTGRGIIEHLNIDPKEIDMVIGSLEGVFGSIGGFCVGSSFIVEHQRLSGLGYCFSASLPPLLTQAARYAFDYLDANAEHVVMKLHRVCNTLHTMLQKIPYFKVTSDASSPIKYVHIVDKYGEHINILHYYTNLLSHCRLHGIVWQLKQSEMDNLEYRFIVNIDMTPQVIRHVFEILFEAAQYYLLDFF